MEASPRRLAVDYRMRSIIRLRIGVAFQSRSLLSDQGAALGAVETTISLLKTDSVGSIGTSRSRTRPTSAPHVAHRNNDPGLAVNQELMEQCRK